MSRLYPLSAPLPDYRLDPPSDGEYGDDEDDETRVVDDDDGGDEYADRTLYPS